MTSLTEQETAGEQAVLHELLRRQKLARYRALREIGYSPLEAARGVRESAAMFLADEVDAGRPLDSYTRRQYRLAVELEHAIAQYAGDCKPLDELTRFERFWTTGRRAA